MHLAQVGILILLLYIPSIRCTLFDTDTVVRAGETSLMAGDGPADWIV